MLCCAPQGGGHRYQGLALCPQARGQELAPGAPGGVRSRRPAQAERGPLPPGRRWHAGSQPRAGFQFRRHAASRILLGQPRGAPVPLRKLCGVPAGLCHAGPESAREGGPCLLDSGHWRVLLRCVRTHLPMTVRRSLVACLLRTAIPAQRAHAQEVSLVLPLFYKEMNTRTNSDISVTHTF